MERPPHARPSLNLPILGRSPLRNDLVPFADGGGPGGEPDGGGPDGRAPFGGGPGGGFSDEVMSLKYLKSKNN